MTWAVYEFDDLPQEFKDNFARQQAGRDLVTVTASVDQRGLVALDAEVPSRSALRSNGVSMRELAAAASREIREAVRILVIENGELPQADKQTSNQDMALLVTAILHRLDAGGAEVSIAAGNLTALRQRLARGISLNTLMNEVVANLSAALDSGEFDRVVSSALAR